MVTKSKRCSLVAKKYFVLVCGNVCCPFHRIMVTLDANNSTELDLDEDEEDESEDVRSLLAHMLVVVGNWYTGVISGAFLHCGQFTLIRDGVYCKRITSLQCDMAACLHLKVFLR